MANTRNLTVRLEEDVIRKARVVAARRGSSISGLVAEAIRSMAEEEDVYAAAMAVALRDLEGGLDLGGPPYLSREAAHER